MNLLLLSNKGVNVLLFLDEQNIAIVKSTRGSSQIHKEGGRGRLSTRKRRHISRLGPARKNIAVEIIP